VGIIHCFRLSSYTVLYILKNIHQLDWQSLGVRSKVKGAFLPIAAYKFLLPNPLQSSSFIRFWVVDKNKCKMGHMKKTERLTKVLQVWFPWSFVLPFFFRFYFGGAMVQYKVLTFLVVVYMVLQNSPTLSLVLEFEVACP